MADKQLDQVRPTFVEKVSAETLGVVVDGILKERVISTEEKEWIMQKNNIRGDQARRLIDTVIKTGAKASAMFIAHIERADPSLHGTLGFAGGQPANSAADNRSEEPCATLTLSTETFWMEKQQKNDVYPADRNAMSNRVALLITNIEFHDKRHSRQGAEKDEENMEILLTSLGFEVVRHTNCTGEQINNAFSDFAKHPKLKDTDSVVMVVMSHGLRGKILGVGHTKQTPDFFDIDEIYKLLGSAKCRALMDKPKIIIIQACRGVKPGSVLCSDGPQSLSEDAYETAPPASTADWEEDWIGFVHREKDFVSLLSSTVDHLSYRNKICGSLLICSVVKIFNQYAHEDHVEKLFTKVMDDVQQFSRGSIMQMPTKDRCTLTKKFYFYPGLGAPPVL